MQRPNFIVYCFLIVFASLVFFQSCTSSFEVASTKFHHPNNISNIRAKVFLEDNTNHLGYLSLNLTQTENAIATVKLPHEKREIKLPFNKITAYETDDVTYVLKTIEPYNNKIFLLGKSQPKQSFVKLLTPKNYTIQVFTSKEKTEDAKSSLPKTREHYFFSINKENNSFLMDMFNPNFTNSITVKLKELANQNDTFSKKFDENLAFSKFSHKSIEQKVEILKSIAAIYQESLN